MARLISRTRVKPPTLSGTAVSSSQIALTAVAPAGFAVASYVFTNVTLGQSVNSTTATYSWTGLNQYTSYAFTARVVDSQGNSSADTSSVTVRTYAQAPTAPNIQATRVSSTRVDLTLSGAASLAGIAAYSFTRATNVAGPFTLLATQASAIYSDTSASSANTYYYRATATDTQSPPLTSAFSGVVTVLASNSPPSWSGTPTTQFTLGSAATVSLSTFCTDPEGDPITYTSIGAALPTGVSIDNVNKRLVYNGAGTAGSTAGVQLRATSTGGTADSAQFTIAIVASTLAWDAIIPTQSLTVGTPYSLDLRTVYEPDNVTLSLISGSLPPGLSLSATVVDGTPTTDGTYTPTFRIDDNASAGTTQDWATRSTSGRILLATNFSSSADFNQTTRVYGANDSTGPTYWKSLVSQYTADSRVATALRISSPANTGANGAAWYCSLNPGGFSGALGSAWTLNSQGLNGVPFYFAFRFKIPSTRLTVRSSQGFKYWDISAYSPVDPANQSYSNTLFEHIGENTNWKQIVSAYHRDSMGSFPAFAQQYDSSVGDIKITDQDNGAGAGSNAARYCLYNGGSYSSGCFPLVANEWLNIKGYISATAGQTTGNVFKLWAARQDATSWTQIYSQSNVNLGTDSRFTGGFCGIWLNAYETSYVNTGTPDTYQLWTELIVSLDDIALPAVGS